MRTNWCLSAPLIWHNVSGALNTRYWRQELMFFTNYLYNGVEYAGLLRAEPPAYRLPAGQADD